MIRFLPIALALVTLISATPSEAQSPPPPRYDISATLDATAARLDVSERVSFVNRTGVSLSSVVVRLPPGGSGAATVHRIEIRGQSVDGSVSGAVIEAPLDPPLAAGERGELVIDFTVALPRGTGRLGVTSRAVTLGNWFGTLAVHRGDWDRRPHTEVGDAFVSEVADFRVTMETAQPLELAFTGQLISRDDRRWTIEATSVRDLAIVASDRFTVASASAGSTAITAYALATSAQSLADSAASFTAWYETRFGPIPYPELKVVETDLPRDYGGMEYPGLVMLAAGYGPLRAGSPYDALVGHEIAHQWFYSFVGSDQIDDPWLDEGFATYLPIIYYLETAPDVGRGMLREVETARPIGRLEASVHEFGGDSSYFAAIYRPAARFLNDARITMGDEAFYGAVREYVTVFGNRIATPRAFLDLLQQRTTANLNPVIQRYFGYGAFTYPTPRLWHIRAPQGRWARTVTYAVEAEFPIAALELWLDGQTLDRQDLSGAHQITTTIDLRGVEAGDYVLLARLWDQDGAIFERAQRVSIP